MRNLLLAAPLLCAPLRCAAAPVHQFLTVALSPDGTKVASIEGDESKAGNVDLKSLVIRTTADGTAAAVPLPCGKQRDCAPSSPVWSADGKSLSFILRLPGGHHYAIYTLDKKLVRRLDFKGTLNDLTQGPNGELGVLATDGAAKETGAVEAGAAQTGVLGTDVHEQRIAVLDSHGTLHWASPPDLYVYEYARRPNGAGFVGTAAHGDGDNKYWIAKLYAFAPTTGAASVIYTPPTPQIQLAQPSVSANGAYVAFIGGLMSDFGSTGGEAYVLPLTPGATATDITPGWPATVTSLQPGCAPGELTASLLQGDKTEVVTLGTSPQSKPPAPLVSVAQTLNGGGGAAATSCQSPQTASVHQSFTVAPEIEVGPLGKWHDLTHANAGQKLAATAQSLVWDSGPYLVQGWLLTPDPKPAGLLPMITSVHGGPAAANQPHFAGANITGQLLGAGYAIFLPNPRGSYGQGEAFTRANVEDFGHGDLKDILAGISRAEQFAPIDDARLGLMGWSYGGYMTMFAVTQTQRFKAAVAGAGIANWQSYYGENGIDEWMIPYFGASVYEDPAVYAKSSPITFIKQVKTPVLEVVGENDVECPAPQTQEFWHALHDLGVPTQSVIYAGEGHRMRDPAHLADYEARVIGWFNKYLKKP